MVGPAILWFTSIRPTNIGSTPAPILTSLLLNLGAPESAPIRPSVVQGSAAVQMSLGMIAVERSVLSPSGAWLPNPEREHTPSRRARRA